MNELILYTQRDRSRDEYFRGRRGREPFPKIFQLVAHHWAFPALCDTDRAVATVAVIM